MKFQIVLKIILTILLVFLPFCSKVDLESDENPVLFSITPSSKAVKMPAFTLTVKGSGFNESSKIFFDNTEMGTSFVNESELVCTIPANKLDITTGSYEDLNAIEIALREVPVLVKNNGEYNSGILNFSIKDNNSFSKSEKISEGNNSSFNPKITIDNESNIFVVYERYEQADEKYFVSIIRSDDGGKVWNHPVDIFESDERIYNPAIASDPDGVINVTFYNEKLYFSCSGDSGETWSVPKLISNSSPTPIESKIAIDYIGNINIVWLISSYSQDTSIYYMRSEDGGSTFSSAINISTERDNFSSVYNISLAVDRSGVYTGWVAWPLGGSRYSHVYFNYSNDNGTTWNSEDKYFGVCSAPDVFANGGSDVYLALSGSYLPFQNRIVLFMSTDSCLSWESGIGVTSESNDTYPLVRTDSEGNINIIFKRSGAYYYIRSYDRGVSWTEPLYVTDKISEPYNKKLIDMTLDKEGTIYIVSEYDNSGVLYFTKSY